jgi:hypothetical protein
MHPNLWSPFNEPSLIRQSLSLRIKLHHHIAPHLWWMIQLPKQGMRNLQIRFC